VTGTSRSLDEVAELAQRWAAVEELLFRTLGEWARAPGEARVRRTLAAWCHRHAWHAELWRSRLPGTSHPVASAAAPARHLDEWTSSWQSPLRDGWAALVTEVLPRMSREIDEQLASTDARIDGPTHRVLTLVRADVAAELSELGALTGG
jgi:hypothetical protein